MAQTPSDFRNLPILCFLYVACIFLINSPCTSYVFLLFYLASLLRLFGLWWCSHCIMKDEADHFGSTTQVPSAAFHTSWLIFRSQHLKWTRPVVRLLITRWRNTSIRSWRRLWFNWGRSFPWLQSLMLIFTQWSTFSSAKLTSMVSPKGEVSYISINNLRRYDSQYFKSWQIKLTQAGPTAFFDLLYYLATQLWA